MIEYEGEILGLEEQLKKLKAYSQIADKHLMRAMHLSVITLERNIIPLVPVGVSGRLRNSIASEVKHEGPLSIVGKVGSTLRNEEYPAVMEFGRRPGAKQPPAHALVRWVHLVMGVPLSPPGKLKRAARNVARAIGARGIKGKKFMEKGFKQSQGAILNYFDAALQAIAKDLENGR